MRIPVFCGLVMVLVLGMCPHGFAQTKDCDDALAACRETCGKVEVWDYATEKFLPDTIVKDQCESVCNASAKLCAQQDAALGCDTFLYRCVSRCPWQTRYKRGMEMMSTTDVFYKCGHACAVGHDVCHASGTKTPQTRARTGTFDTCAEAQGACYTTCMASVPMDSRGIKVPSDFPDTCAQACAAGVGPCDEGGEKMCDNYYGNCAQACPDAVYDDEFGGFYSDTDNGKNCLRSCEAGADHCARLIK